MDAHGKTIIESDCSTVIAAASKLGVDKSHMAFYYKWSKTYRKISTGGEILSCEDRAEYDVHELAIGETYETFSCVAYAGSPMRGVIDCERM